MTRIAMFLCAMGSLGACSSPSPVVERPADETEPPPPPVPEPVIICYQPTSDTAGNPCSVDSDCDDGSTCTTNRCYPDDKRCHTTVEANGDAGPGPCGQDCYCLDGAECRAEPTDAGP